MMFISKGKTTCFDPYGHIQVLTTFLLKDFYIIRLNHVVMLRSHHNFMCFC